MATSVEYWIWFAAVDFTVLYFVLTWVLLSALET